MSKIKVIVDIIKEPKNIILQLALKGFFNLVPDEIYLKIMFRLRTGCKIDLNNPQTYNEKLQWLKLYERKDIYTKLVDKYEVRGYISDTIGEEYLIPLLGVYDKFDDINFDSMPEQFVLKCTHNSGGIVICKNKSEFKKELARKKINKSLKRNYFYWGREWPYKNVKQRIICEKYMVDESQKDLKDYKFMCFNGQVKCMHICRDRNTNSGLKIDYYDTKWNYIDVKKEGTFNSGELMNKPASFEKMIRLAEILSKNIPFVRVDFYDINGNIYFGELTFYPDSGFKDFIPENYNKIFGEWIKL